jgi:cell division protease FtsH
MVLEKQRSTFLGGGYAPGKEYSDATAEKLDDHIKILLEQRYEVVKQRLRDYAPAIEKMTAQLLEIEVIDGEEVRKVIREFETKNNLPTLLSEIDDELGHHVSKREAKMDEDLNNEEENDGTKN